MILYYKWKNKQWVEIDIISAYSSLITKIKYNNEYCIHYYRDKLSGKNSWHGYFSKKHYWAGKILK